MEERFFTLRGLIGHAWATVQNPRDGLRGLTSLGLDRSHLWQALVIVVILSAILAQVDAMVLGLPGIPIGPNVFVPPWTAALMQFAGLVLIVFAVFWIGRAVGGEGAFEDAIVAVVWLQFVMVCLQIIQSLLYIVIPPMGSLLAIFGIGLFFYLLTQFVAEVHGFESLWRVFFMILMALFGISFGLMILLSLIGITVPGPV